ncbi:hypothetical protein BDW74DRAFT_182973 [Aspergillus multicolor]|uniref:F-box protein n=1 Tax=Aspergillus multicolor TaxID=41759 RepID=UPI003CCCA028
MSASVAHSCTLTSLPVELIYMITFFLDPRDISALLQTNSVLNAILEPDLDKSASQPRIGKMSIFELAAKKGSVSLLAKIKMYADLTAPEKLRLKSNVKPVTKALMLALDFGHESAVEYILFQIFETAGIDTTIYVCMATVGWQSQLTPVQKTLMKRGQLDQVSLGCPGYYRSWGTYVRLKRVNSKVQSPASTVSTLYDNRFTWPRDSLQEKVKRHGHEKMANFLMGLGARVVQDPVVERWDEKDRGGTQRALTLLFEIRLNGKEVKEVKTKQEVSECVCDPAAQYVGQLGGNAHLFIG